MNPAHLFLGTRADNMRDMHAKGRAVPCNVGMTHCRRGHEFTPENTHVRPCGRRLCRACVRDRKNERYRTDPAYRETILTRLRDRYRDDPDYRMARCRAVANRYHKRKHAAA